MRLLKSQSDSDISISYKSYPKISNWYLLKENPSTNLEKIYTSPYRSFNFQQLFFYDIFFAKRVFYELSVVKV